MDGKKTILVKEFHTVIFNFHLHVVKSKHSCIKFNLYFTQQKSKLSEIELYCFVSYLKLFICIFELIMFVVRIFELIN